MSQFAHSAPAAQFAPATPILILLAYLAFISLDLPDALLGVAHLPALHHPTRKPQFGQ